MNWNREEWPQQIGDSKTQLMRKGKGNDGERSLSMQRDGAEEINTKDVWKNHIENLSWKSFIIFLIKELELSAQITFLPKALGWQIKRHLLSLFLASHLNLMVWSHSSIYHMLGLCTWRNKVSTNQEASSLLASFHSTRRYSLGCFGEKLSTILPKAQEHCRKRSRKSVRVKIWSGGSK